MLSWGLGWTGGALLAGAVVDVMGLRPTMLAFALVQVLAVVIAWVSPWRHSTTEHSTAAPRAA